MNKSLPMVLSSALLIATTVTGCNEESAPDENLAKVFKGNGAIQCQPDSGTPLDVMQMELVNAGIDVVCAQILSDGFAYIDVCGETAGDVNVYEIRAANVPDAEALGFRNVLEIPEFVDQVCTLN